MSPTRSAEVVAQVSQLLEQIESITGNYGEFMQQENPGLLDALQQASDLIRQSLIDLAEGGSGDSSGETV